MAGAALSSPDPSLRSRRPLTRRRLFGLDRSGPPPRATQAGEPLRPWTLPNLIGLIRLAAIPVFLVLALQSHHGRDAAAAAIFGAIGWSDYLDGFVARATGQYSRFGALLDPVVDRLLVISGMVVVWHFNLLPRWAIVVVVVREVLMLALSRVALSRGVELAINWFGRVGVAPAMAAPFFAMAGVHWLALVLLYIGIVLAWLATVFYVRDGLEQTRRAPAKAQAQIDPRANAGILPVLPAHHDQQDGG